MKKALFAIAFGALIAISAPACFSQEYCMGQPYAQYCNPQPCYDVYSNVPAQYNQDLVNRYAELAGKYRNYGVNERQAAIANGETEAIELNNLDRHFTQYCDPSCLTPEQQLTVSTAQATVKRQ
ncbi:MAG: hypothetical protein J1E99_08515 [Muribaculaceae bacterium]|nr:hypothetical protein [Muribaculaceae bacterium]